MTVADSAVVHPTAIVEEGARLAASVRVGPFCVVGAQASLGEGVTLDAHVCIAGETEIGPRTRVFPFASLGSEPQDLKFAGERTRLTIGADCKIREHVTMNPGTEGGGGLTSVGDRCLFMMGSHVAHDCRVGSNVIAANNATLAGHVEVGDFAVLGGLCAVHQFVRIGDHSMIGGMSGVERDVIPAGTVMGNRAHLAGLNLTGLKRRGVEREAIHRLRHAYRTVFEGGEGELIERAQALAAELPGDGPARAMVGFILAGSNRRFCLPG